MMSAAAVDPLTRLAIVHGTDKFGPHFYTPHYHALLSQFRALPVRLLEIGVGGYGYSSQGGRSLAMWADYLPHARIVGIDVEPKSLRLDPRITILQGSQDDPAFLIKVCNEHGPFHVVIDDGSHIPRHMIASFEVLFPRMLDGGLYFLEDTQTAFMPSFEGEAATGGQLYAWAGDILRGLNHVENAVSAPHTPVPQRSRQIRSFHAWHNLFVFEKGDNNEPSNFDARLGNAAYFQQAASVMEAVLAETPTPVGVAGFAALLRVTGAKDRAAAVVEHALRTWPNDASLLLSAAGLAKELGRRQDALGYLQRAAASEPGDARITAELMELRRGRVS
jgi:hypothetical protein